MPRGLAEMTAGWRFNPCGLKAGKLGARLIQLGALADIQRGYDGIEVLRERVLGRGRADSVEGQNRRGRDEDNIDDLGALALDAARTAYVDITDLPNIPNEVVGGVRDFPAHERVQIAEVLFLLFDGRDRQDAGENRGDEAAVFILEGNAVEGRVTGIAVQLGGLEPGDVRIGLGFEILQILLLCRRVGLILERDIDRETVKAHGGVIEVMTVHDRFVGGAGGRSQEEQGE